MHGDPRLVWQKQLGPLLWPAGWLYSGVQRLRRRAYGMGVLPTIRVDRPVVSVGSLLAGGTGKTPLVAFLANTWRAQRVAVLSRGYGGSYADDLLVLPDTSASLAGDEPVLLTRRCAADVWVSRKRAGLALRLADRYDLFLLDDGYQHLELERFLNICVLPREKPGRLLPAGLWREGPGAVSAADLVVGLEGWPEWVDDYYQGPHVVIELRRTEWQTSEGASRPEGPVFAFCGVARPERFLDSLQDVELVGSTTWPDHHAYGEADLHLLHDQARRVGARAFVTTAKDAVRLRAEELHLPLHWCDLEVLVVQCAPEFKAFLDDLVPPR